MRLTLFATPLLALAAAALQAQLPAGTSDASSSATASPSPEAAARAQASDALDRGDFAAALRILQPLAEKNPSDAHVLFDLASAQDALANTPVQISVAEATYRKAVAADSTFFEPHLALGLLLARNGRDADARTELQSATALNASDPALKARAWRALAHLEEKTDPAAARDALLAALKLSPPTPDDDLLSASLAKAGQEPAQAEAAYRRLLAGKPNDPDAAAGLAHLLLEQGKLPDAEAILAPALAAHAGDPQLTLAMASLRARQQRPADAATLVGDLYRRQSTDDAVGRVYARLLSQTGDYEQVDQVLAPLVARSPQDGPLLDQLADALIHLKRFAEAERLLSAAVQNPSSFPTHEAFAEAAGHLAFAASSNNDPEDTLRALTLRATFLPQSPPTLFLSAAAHDRLHHLKQAKELYRQFLAAANGKFPDEETDARHRLVALEHTH